MTLLFNIPGNMPTRTVPEDYDDTSHRMFTMSHQWERFFYLLTFIGQGSSFLSPREAVTSAWT